MLFHMACDFMIFSEHLVISNIHWILEMEGVKVVLLEEVEGPWASIVWWFALWHRMSQIKGQVGHLLCSHLTKFSFEGEYFSGLK